MDHTRRVFVLPALLLLLLFVAPLPGLTGPIWRELQDAAHVVIFAGVAVLIRVWLDRRPAQPPTGSVARTLLAFLGAIAIGAAVEALQAIGARDASWGDVLRDAAGAAAGLLVLSALRARRAALAWRLARVAIAAIIAAYACQSLWQQAAAQIESRRTWPTLLSAASEQAPVNIVRRFAGLTRQGDHWRVHFEREPWPGVTLQGWPRNWQGYRRLVVDLRNPTDQSLQVGIAVRDGADTNEYRNRFNTARPVAAGQRLQITLPLTDVVLTPGGRKLDLTDIRSLTVFRTGGSADLVDVFVIRLE